MSTSKPISGEEFLDRLTESLVLSGDDPRAAFGDVSDIDDGRMLAEVLVEAGRLTQFQADAILEGRLKALSVGNYTILSRLGAGGMGTVFKARHRSMKRIVAIKMLTRDTPAANDHAHRFQREVETVAGLFHPNIVMAYDAGETDHGLYLVMEFIDGRDLAVEVRERGPLSVADAVHCVIQAARGLAYAHQNGIVHRDVKPANLLRDSKGVVKVADLGLAQLANAGASAENASLTVAGSILGTADYIAPEQALDSSTVDHRVDIYSLGCTLYFLLAGKPMYSAGSLMALLLKHRDAPIPSLSDVRADIPAELDQIYQRATAKNPDERYPAMDELIDALARLESTVALSDVRPNSTGSLPASQSPANVTMASAPLAAMESCDFELNDSLADAIAVPSSSIVRRVSDIAVVLVEPSRFQARIAQRLLADLHIENVLTAGSGREALELSRREGTTVVLSSMELPDMTGMQLAQALHDDPGSSGVGFVVASTNLESLDIKNPLDAPPVVYLAKPFDSKSLAGALAQATGRVVDEILG